MKNSIQFKLVLLAGFVLSVAACGGGNKSNSDSAAPAASSAAASSVAVSSAAASSAAASSAAASSAAASSAAASSAAASSAAAVTYADWSPVNGYYTQYLNPSYTATELPAGNRSFVGGVATFTATSTADKGMRAQFDASPSPSNLSGKTSVKVVGLAASGATEVRMYLQFTGYSYNDCTPFYLINGVTTTPQDFVVDLTSPISDATRSSMNIVCNNNTAPNPAPGVAALPSAVLGSITNFILEARQTGLHTLTVQKIQVNN